MILLLNLYLLNSYIVYTCIYIYIFIFVREGSKHAYIFLKSL